MLSGNIPFLLSVTNGWNNLFAGVTVNPFSWQTGVAIAVVLLLLLLSGYMSSSECAFFSLNPQDIDAIRNSNSKTDRTLLALLEHSEPVSDTHLG